MPNEDLRATTRLDGDTELLEVFDHVSNWAGIEGRAMLTHLAGLSEALIKVYAPVGETGAIVSQTSHKPAERRIGGVGGGSYYEAQAGVPPIRGGRDTWGRFAGPSLYPRDVELGTANDGRLRIYSSRNNGRLTFKKQGEERRYRHYVSGQKGQRFVFAAYRSVSIYTRTRLLTLGREVVRRGVQPEGGIIMEASVATKPDTPEGPINKSDMPPEEEKGPGLPFESNEESEEEQSSQDDKKSEEERARLEAEAELDKLDPMVEVVSYTIGKPPEKGGEKNEYSIYTQQPLGYVATLRFYGLVGKTVAEAVKAGGVVDLGDAFNNSAGNVQDRAKQIMEQSFNDAGSFAALIFQLVAYSPDFILEFYCIALDIPNTTERRWAKAVMEQPYRPESNKWGLTRQQGTEIIERFIDQNYDEVRDFFGDLVGNVTKRVRKNEKRRKSTSDQSK